MAEVLNILQLPPSLPVHGVSLKMLPVHGVSLKMLPVHGGWLPHMAELMADGVGCPTATIRQPNRPKCNPGFNNYCNDYCTNSAFVNNFFMTVPQMGAIESLLDI